MSNERIQCDGCKRDRACLLAGRCLDAEPLHDDYKPLDHDPDKIERCPVCGSEGKLWQYTTSPTSSRQLVVMCDHGEPIGPQDGIRDEGCLLYMPPESFYQARITDAVRYWNDFAKALIELRATPNRSTTVSDITQDAEKIEDIMALADEYAHRRWSAAVSACHFDKLGEKQADADAAEARAALDAAIRQAMGDDAAPTDRIGAALAAPGSERLRDYYATGPVQRASVETFVAALGVPSLQSVASAETCRDAAGVAVAHDPTVSPSPTDEGTK